MRIFALLQIYSYNKHFLGIISDFKNGSNLKNISAFTKLTLLFMSSATLLSSVAVTTTMPHLKEHFNSPLIEFYARLMLTAPSLAIAFLAPFMGGFIEKFGKKNSAILGFILFSFFGSAGLYLNSIELMLGSRFLLGIAIAIIMIVSTSLVGDYFEGEERYKFMSVQNSFIAAGGVVFVVGGGILTDIFWRLPFGVYLLGVLFIPAVLLHIFDVKVTHSKVDTPSSKRLYGIYFLAFIYMSFFFIMPTQMPFLMMNVYNASGKLAGFIIATSFFASSIGALFYSRLKSKLSFSNLYLVAICIISFGMICIGFVTNLHLFFITSFILGFGGGIAMTNMPAWMLSYTNLSQRVKASSFLVSSFFLGQFFSPFLTHPFVEKFGVQNTFKYLGACIFIVCISFLIGLNRR